MYKEISELLVQSPDVCGGLLRIEGSLTVDDLLTVVNFY